MTRPRLLDLFSGAGGCSVGYARAGFDVVGVDLHPQPNYPYEFRQLDALDMLRALIRDGNLAWDRFDAIHASPPCQAYSTLRHAAEHKRDSYPDLIPPTRELLEVSGLPYVIENVVGAPLIDPLMLCGSMFGLDVKRHRLFETSWPRGLAPGCNHGAWMNRYPTHARKDKAQLSPVVHVYGTGGGAGKDLDLWRRVMGVEWMQTKAEVAEAIPPAYTEFVGAALMAHLSTEGRLSPDPAPSQASL